MVAGAVILCPYCGHVQSGAAEGCQSCGGSLTMLDRRATQTGMGPWFVRDQNQPFFPGFEYDVLKKKLTSAKIGPTTLLRGPTTHQLWAPARAVPGVAHLKGLCHNCGASANPKSSSCDKCGSPFPSPRHRDELGLPWASPAEVIRQFRTKNPTLCPICGENTPSRDNCLACGTVFDPAEAATAISLGPWYIRDTRVPFRPGCSFDHLMKMIEEGRVQETTVMRGPSTQQFWVMAKNVQGVSQQFGSCFKCGAQCSRDQQQCPQCQASLMAPTETNRLGLMYPTAALAEEARKTLDLLRMQAEANPIDKDVQLVPVSDDDADTLMEQEKEYHGEEGYYDDYYDDEPAVFDEQEAAWEGPPEEALAAVAVGPAPSKLSPEAVAEAREAAAAQKEMEKIWQMLLLSVPVVVLAIVGIYFLASGGGGTVDPEKNERPKAKVADSTTDSGGPVNQKLMAFRQLQQQAEAKYELVKGVDKAFKPRLTKASNRMDGAKRLLRLEKYDDATKILNGVLTELDAIKSEAAQRVTAMNAKQAAQKARESAKAARADELAAQGWVDSEDKFLDGQDAFIDGKFDEAITAWKASAAGFTKARDGVLVIGVAKKAQEDYKKRLTEKYTLKQMNRAASDALKKVEAVAKDADTAMRSANYTSATTKYKQAASMVPQIEASIRKNLGVKYWAYNIGRVSTEIMFAMAAETPPTQAQLDELKKGYNEVGLPTNFFNKVPTGNDADYETLKSVILDEAQIQLEATVGIEASEAFGLAKDFKTVEVILDRLKSNSKLSGLVAKQVEKIRISAQAAGFSPKFILFLNKFETSAKQLPMEGAINVCNVMWSEMSKKLVNFDTAIELVNQ